MPEKEIEVLQRDVAVLLDTFGSASSMLSSISNHLESDSPEISTDNRLKKDFILDSFKVSKLQKDYKEWESRLLDKFVAENIGQYNKVLGQMSQINSNMELLNIEFEGLQQSVKLPSFQFSILTLKEYGDESILQNIRKDENGEYPLVIDIDKIYSTDSKSGLPFPDYKVFNQLVNIEYRLRIQKRVKHEVLLLFKNQISSNNSKWQARDQKLQKFLQKDLAGVLQEIKDIKASEYEDLRALDDESSDDSAFEQELDQGIEEEDEKDAGNHHEHEETALGIDEVEMTLSTSSGAKNYEETDEQPMQTEQESEDDMLIDN